MLVDPFRAGFMQRALIELLLLAVLSGVVGVFVQLRDLAFIADALTHTMFPGLAIAFALGHSLLIGGTIAAVVSAVALTILANDARIDPDAAMVALLTTCFAIGVLVVSRSRSFTADLTALLFGRPLTVDRSQILQTIAIGVVVLLVVGLLGKELLLRAFDPAVATAMGYRVLALDVMLNVAVSLVVVAALRSVGTLLVLTLIVTPAAIARTLTSRLGLMIPTACGVAALASWLGLGVSYDLSVQHDLRVAAGPTIAVGLAMTFFIVTVGRSVVRRGAALGVRRERSGAP